MLCSNGAMPCEARDLKKMAPGGTRSESLQLAPGPGLEELDKQTDSLLSTIW